MADPVTTRKHEALALADALLADIELSRLPPADIARKTFRLARLIDDSEAMAWLRFEIAGYPSGSLPPDAWSAAARSNRVGQDGKPLARTTSLGQLQTNIDGALAQIAAAADASISITSANPHQRIQEPKGNTLERSGARLMAGAEKALLDKVLGAIHQYVTDQYQTLRFGSAIETAFEVVRTDVDARVIGLVPEAPGMLAAALENAASDNPEHWANAASVCRRLLKAAADALRPPGEPVDGRVMTDSAYINRLVDWIVNTGGGGTGAGMIVADLEYLGRRLDAVDKAGHKGAHARVDRFDASRFLTGTYLLLGDILRLHGAEPAPHALEEPGADIVGEAQGNVLREEGKPQADAEAGSADS